MEDTFKRDRQALQARGMEVVPVTQEAALAFARDVKRLEVVVGVLRVVVGVEQGGVLAGVVIGAQVGERALELEHVGEEREVLLRRAQLAAKALGFTAVEVGGVMMTVDEPLR